MFVTTNYIEWNYSMELGERGKGKENDRVSVISYNMICEG
jgi:hypothetical protein